MEFKTLATGQKIPSLGLGTWKMGGVMLADRSNDKKYIEAITYALKKGISHIDTAEIYGAGHTEELVGEAIRQLADDRKKLFITTKIRPLHLFTANQIRNACKNSLKRLGTDYADLYLIHWPNPIAPMRTVMATLDELVEDGLVKNIGVSNFSLSQLKNAQKLTKNKIVCNQVHYNLFHRDPEEELLPFCQKEGVILTAYTPIAKGQMRGKSDTLEKVAQKYNKTPIQVALRWLLEKPNVIVIPKASSPQHIDEILGSLGWKMKKEDQDALSYN